MPLRHDSAAHGGPTPAMPSYVCLFCDTAWPYARVRSLARCPDCGGPLVKTDGSGTPQGDSAV
jgi:DNA-directed RNA polymerase subunit RPC12/RpoP